MRILHVNKFLYRRGGAEGYMLDVAQLQREQGHEVAFFGMDHPDNDRPQRFGASFPAHVELEPPPPGVARLRAAGRMVWSTSASRGMRDVVRQFRPDVVHCHNVYHQLSPSVLQPLRAAGVPCVMTLHDYKLACPSYQLLDHGRLCDACVTGGLWQAARRRCKDDSLGASALLSLESWVHRTTGAWSAVDLFISPSQFLAGVMARAGVFPERMRVVNHFVDPGGPGPADQPGQGVVFAGRLAPEKGVDTLIEAVARMSTPTTLTVAGDGPVRAALEEHAARVAPGRVEFVGRLGKAALQQVVRRSVASVVPSVWHENQPMTVLEAFALAVPVVCTDLGGLPELVRDGVDGAVVPAGDPGALAGALDAMVADPAAAHRMGVAARERMVVEFSPQVHLDRVAGVYEEARMRVQGRVGTGTGAQR
ncbi:MAG: glycosyltransferase family 4 protein [Oryzihumus sp.]